MMADLREELARILAEFVEEDVPSAVARAHGSLDALLARTLERIAGSKE